MADKRIDQLPQTRLVSAGARMLLQRDPTNASAQRATLGIDAGDLFGAFVSGRALKDALYSDGATSNRRVEWTPGAAGAVAGQPISIPFELDVPTANPSAPAVIHAFCGSAASAPTSQANACNVYVSTAGALVVEQLGATPGTDFRRLTYAGFRAAYSGVKGLRGMVVFESGDTTTAPKIYIQGVDTSASFTLTTGGTAPNWMPLTLDSTYYLVGYNAPAIRLVPHGPILGALTAAEVLEWTQTGRLPTWCEVATGSVADVILNAVDRDMSAPNNWSPLNSGSVSVIGGKLVVTNANTDAGARLASAYLRNIDGKAAIGGQSMRLRITIANATAPVRVRGWDNNLGTVCTFLNGVSAGTYDVVGRFTGSLFGGLAVRIDTTSGSAESFEITNVSLQSLGPIIKPQVQPIPVLADTGSNAIAGLLFGMTPLTQRRDWIIQASTSTSGNQQLLGADLLRDYTRQVIDDWVINNKGSASRTVSLGGSSGSTFYLNAGTAAVGRNYITLASRAPGANALWCNSNGTDQLQHTVRGHIVD